MADLQVDPREPLSTPNDQIVVPQPAPKPSGPVAGLRALYPELSDLNDDQLLKGVHKTTFADLTEEQYLRGLAKTYGAVEKPKNFLEQLHDHLSGKGEPPDLRAGALTLPAGIASGVTMFGKGIADAAAGEDTPERKFVTDTLTSVPKSLWGDLKATATTMRSVYRLLPPDIQAKLPKGTVPTDEELSKSNVRTVASLASLYAGGEVAPLLKEAGAGLIRTAAAEGATYGGTYEAITATMQGKKPEEIGRQTLAGTIAGGVAGPVLAKGTEALAAKSAEAAAAIPAWFGKPTAEPVPVRPGAPGAQRLGTPPAPEAVEPHPVELPAAQPTRIPLPGSQEAMPGGGVPVTFQPVESPAGAHPGLAPEPNTLPGQVPGLVGNAAQAPAPVAARQGPIPGLQLPQAPVAPEITPADLVGPLEQPRPAAPPMEVQPTAVQPSPTQTPLGVTSEGPLPAGPPPGFEPNAVQSAPAPGGPIPPAARRPFEPAPRLGPGNPTPGSIQAGISNAAKLHAESGGSTVSLATGQSLAGTPTIAVSLWPERTTILDGPALGADQIAAFVGRNADLFQDPSVSLGTWFDKASNKTHLDAVKTFSEGDRAKAIEAAQQHNQQAAFDLRKMEEIPTGGTGAATPATPGLPTPPGRWRQYVEFADQNISDAKARIIARQQAKGLTGDLLTDLLAGEGGFADPANIRDAGIIGANYILRGVASTAELGEALVRDLGEAARPHLDRLVTEAHAIYNGRRPAGNDGVRAIASHYMEEFGAQPLVIPTKYERVDPAWGRKVADAYDALPATDKAANASYAAFKDEVRRQFAHAQAAGIKFEFAPVDKYNGDSAAMMADLRNNNRIVVLKTPEDFGHPMLTPEENDMFHAVHDLHGHAREGYSFGPDGEYNAWRSHTTMFSNKAIPAMSTETIGQTAWTNFGKQVKKGSAPSQRAFAEQKAALLPDWVYKDQIEARSAGESRVSTAKGFKRTVTGGEQKLPQVAKALTKRIKPVEDERFQVGRAQADIDKGLPDYQKANPQAAEWYHQDVAQFEKNTQAEFLDTKDPDRMSIYKLVLAVTSPSRNPVHNVDAASRLWDAYNKTGSVPIIGRLGQEMGRSIRPSLTNINRLLREQGSPEQVVDYLTAKDGSGVYNAVNEFGPKVGRFWLNLMGIHDEVTVDVWMTRWWHRITGTPFDKNGELVDVPATDKEHELIRRTVADLAKQKGMAPDALQAVIWDREKKLWRDAGGRDSGNIAFADASSIVFRNRASAREKTAGLLGQPQQEELSLESLRKAAAVNPLQFQGSPSSTSRMMMDARANKMIVKPDAVKGDAFWVAPDGSIIEVGKSLHSMVAKKLLRFGGINAPDGIIGMNNAANQLLQNKGFIRAQTQYGHLAVEFARGATDSQKRTLVGFLKEYPFGGGQAVSAEGKMGDTAGTWAEFLRLSDTLE